MSDEGDRPDRGGQGGPDRGDDDLPDPRGGPVAAATWFLRTDRWSVAFVRELLSSALAVLLVGVLLFAVSGVWPPMVAVESGSMEPNMYRGDLVFVMEEHRFAPAVAYGDTGVVTYRDGRNTDYRKLGDHGDVIVFASATRRRPPIIHRARFWVDRGENWYLRANETYLRADSCDELAYCPAPHAGFITKGDANPYYDQANRISPPVRPEWIRGTAELRVPWLGHVRLLFSGAVVTPGGVPAATEGATVVPRDEGAEPVAGPLPGGQRLPLG